MHRKFIFGRSGGEGGVLKNTKVKKGMWGASTVKLGRRGGVRSGKSLVLYAYRERVVGFGAPVE